MFLHEVARKTNLERCFIRHVEKGRAIPSLETLERFADALDVELWKLFYTGEKPVPPQYLTAPRQLPRQRGKPGGEARFFSKLRPFLARIPERDRVLFPSFVKGLASRRRNKA